MNILFKFFLIFYFLTSIFAFGQNVKVKSLSYKIVYVGIKNKLLIDKINNNTLIDSITVNNGIIFNENNNYYFTPVKSGLVSLNIYFHNQKKSFVIKQDLIAEKLPKPEVRIGGFCPEFFGCSIKYVNGISAIIRTPVEEPIGLKSSLTTYEFTYYHTDTIFISKKQKGFLDNEIRQAINNNTTKGDKLRFENIKVIGISGEEIEIDYILEVTEK